MKKVFCFYCQKDVSPFKFWKWSFCPYCLHKTIDGGDGLYLVCDRCGANIPVDSEYCLKCGHGVNGNPDNEQFVMLPENKSWLKLLQEAGLFAFSILLAAGILYISVYFLLIVLALILVLGLGYMIYSGIKQKF